MSSIVFRPLLLAGLIASAPMAASVGPDAGAAAAPSTRFTVRNAQFDEASQGDGRFRMRARFAAPESAGELHESGGWAMIGRLAKAGSSCDVNAIFRNGFEPD